MDEMKFVFDDEDKKWVEAPRTVTDITTLAVKIKIKNADTFIQNKFAKIIKSVGGVQIRIAWKDIL